MQIRTLDTRRARDVNQFIQFPFDLYRDNKLWVPPLISDMKLVMNRRKHPFYRHSDAAFLIAEEGRKTLGRVAVLENRNFAAYRQRKTAFFYYFDAIDDADVSTALLNAAFAWARDRGLEDIRGPVGFLQGDGLGLLVEGFEHRPAMGIAYNYAYYDGLMRAARLEKATDFMSGYLPGDYDLPERFFEVAQRVRERRGLWVKSFTSGRELKQWAPRIGEVFNSAFVEDWEYFPMPEADILAAANRLVQVADPRLIKLVMKRSDRGDEIIGFVFGFPDLSAALQRIKGRMFPFGWYYLLREFKRTRWVNFNGLGLLPGHQGVGGNAVLYTELAKSAREFHFKDADVVQIEEGNLKSLGDMSAIGVRWYKRHRIYERKL